MKDFLTDFYNKVVNFFQAEKVEGENSKVTAKNRLKLVLMQDRSNLEPETMAKLRTELVEVISKYIVIDKDALGLNLDGDGESMALMLNIPVLRAKTPEEIAEALAEDKKSTEKVEESDETVESEAEETIVEFSEGSIDEIECECSDNCQCECQNGESCTCECECNCEETCECEEANEATEQVETAAEETEVKPEEQKSKKK